LIAVLEVVRVLFAAEVLQTASRQSVVAPRSVVPMLYDKLNFNLIRDIAPVAAISREPHIMVANPSVPASTVPEFIANAKANPGKISMASGGMGTVSHLSGELFKMTTGVNLVHVPYRGLSPR
jgi:tripartite-type tricarboxylate transporter receptor subunit TctC